VIFIGDEIKIVCETCFWKKDEACMVTGYSTNQQVCRDHNKPINRIIIDNIDSIGKEMARKIQLSGGRR
jgi:hypothetical protein